MKFTGKVIRVAKQGKIKFPKSILKKISFNHKKDQLAFSQEKEYLVVQKKEIVCFITGKANEVIEILPGMFVSREGMVILLKELKKHVED